LIAVQFLTRIPVSVQPGASQTEHRRAIAFFPVVGFLLGLAGTALYLALSLILPQAAAVVGVFMGLALTTGGLHEDGLADCADGFGGGYSRDQVLKIMRDSHIGTFGVLALGFVVSLKVISLTELVDWKFYRALVMAQVLSRWSVLPLAWALPQARSEGLGSGFSTQLRPVPILLATTFTLPLGAFLYRWYFCRPFWWRLWWWGSSAFIVFEESGVSRETAMALPSSWSNCPSICRWS
jgi:adenosylcobinamide-GDP ribazoletransferase